MQEVDDLNRHIDLLSQALDRILVAKPVDWDAARARLEEISLHAVEINANLDRLTEDQGKPLLRLIGQHIGLLT